MDNQHDEQAEYDVEPLDPTLVNDDEMSPQLPENESVDDVQDELAASEGGED